MRAQADVWVSSFVVVVNHILFIDFKLVVDVFDE